MGSKELWVKALEGQWEGGRGEAGTAGPEGSPSRTPPLPLPSRGPAADRAEPGSCSRCVLGGSGDG